MINSKFSFCFILIYFICVAPVLSQTHKANSFSIQLNIQHQDLPIDLDVGELQTIHKVSLRPYVSADVQYNFSQSEKKSRFVSAHIGYYYNPYNSRWLSTNIGYGARVNIFNRMSISPIFELGIGFARDQSVEYTFENDKWIGQSTASYLTYEFIAKPRLDILYSMSSTIDLAFSMHGMLISDEDLILIPYYGIGVGLRYSL